MPRLVLFRADAGPAVGAGHVRRCLALAGALSRRGWRVGFAGIAESARAVPQLETGGVQWLALADGADELAAMRAAFGPADLLVIDHYGRDAAFERAGRGLARRIAALDDWPARAHDVDLLLDQTAGRGAAEYSGLVPDRAVVLAGSEYALLRGEIAAETPRAKDAQARNILVTFGGADGDDLSMRAAAALADPRLADLKADVVVGRAYGNAAALAAAAAPNTNVAVDPPDLPRIMAQADLALTGSGTTCWELAYLGVPALIAVNSPGRVAQAMADAGAARVVGAAAELDARRLADALAVLAADAPARAAMSAAGRRLIDGGGPGRAADALERLVD